MKRQNAKLYRELSQPFATVEEAEAAVQAFADDLHELRRKHRIPDVLTVIEFVVIDGEDEGPRIASFAFGDQLKTPTLAAYAFGMFAHDTERLVTKIIADAAKRAKKDEQVEAFR